MLVLFAILAIGTWKEAWVYLAGTELNGVIPALPFLEAVSRSELLNAVWGYDSSSLSRTVDTHIAKLRQKIEADPRSPRHIITIHGIGYKFLV